MTEKEILTKQEELGNQTFYLALVGKFLHAIDYGAFALSRATGYKIVRKKRKSCELPICGFPIEKLDVVRERIREAGGYIEQINNQLFRFGGIDGTPDESMVSEPTHNKTDVPSRNDVSNATQSYLVNEILSFNISLSTPMDAMNFIVKLQKYINLNIANNVPGEDCLQGKTSGIACESPTG